MLISILLPKLSGGGISRTRTTLAAGFLETGASVEFVLEKETGELQSLLPPGASLHVTGPLRLRKMVRELARYFRDRRPDVLLTSKELHTFAAVIARWLTRSRVRILPSMHGDFRMRLTQNRNWAEQAWLPPAVRFFYGRTDFVVGVSESVSRGLVEDVGLPLSKVTTILNPFDIARIRQEAKIGQKHPWLAPDREFPCLVSAGRLAPQKDYGTSLRALRHVADARPVRLVVLGDGPERSSLAEQVTRLDLTDYVDFLGFVENPFPYIAAADAFVLSSRWEGLPGVVVQALALGRSVVATDAPGGTSEILGDGYGRLVPVGDPQSLSSGILEALDCPTLPSVCERRSMDFDVSCSVRKYLELFRRASVADQ